MTGKKIVPKATPKATHSPASRTQDYMVDFYGMRLDYREQPDYILEELVEQGVKVDRKKVVAERDMEQLYVAQEIMVDGDYAGAEKIFLSLIKKYDFFLPAYGMLWQTYFLAGNKEGAREYACKAYQIVQSRYPTYPDDMTWGIVEYRAALRVMSTMASEYHYDGDTEKAIVLYKTLLRLTPRDNQGIRYLLAGLYAGVFPHEIDAMTDEGNQLQDWSKLEDLVDQQNALHHFWEEPDDE